ncbi:hypothetical protein PROFUN_05238 [Planoprotostelium fungivorum]|uniref:Lon N-terminal domain-containing protein n=1 Tax=Planoprotostelium fungivorum TaxID=1890364 RepID=A0A2P6NRQ8_9EUKA|nr:hypothetical protein PROFUN_05238 [Planoprotostelium fungivorum]
MSAGLCWPGCKFYHSDPKKDAQANISTYAGSCTTPLCSATVTFSSETLLTADETKDDKTQNHLPSYSSINQNNLVFDRIHQSIEPKKEHTEALLLEPAKNFKGEDKEHFVLVPKASLDDQSDVGVMATVISQKVEYVPQLSNLDSGQERRVFVLGLQPVKLHKLEKELTGVWNSEVVPLKQKTAVDQENKKNLKIIEKMLEKVASSEILTRLRKEKSIPNVKSPDFVWWICTHLPRDRVEFSEQQRLLGMTSVVDRIQFCTKILSTVFPDHWEEARKSIEQ